MSSFYNNTDLEKDVHRAESILSFFTEFGRGQDIKKLIPPSVLARAHGIMFIRLYRVGFLVSAKGGTGVIIARLPDGSWSAPSGISLTSVGFGHQAGGEIIDSIIVMNYRGAVKAFFDAGGQIQLGVAVSVAAGPLGRSADVSASASNMNHIAATYAYSSSKGLFVGYSFEGSKISERVKTNASFYGRQISAREILTGAVPPPQMASELYNILYSIGAAGPQPGITFGPVKSLSMGSPYSQHMAVASPPLSPHSTGTGPGSFYSGKNGYQQQIMAPPASSPAMMHSPYPPGAPTTPNGYPVEKAPQQQQHQLSPYHRGSLQPSSSIRNPPQLNPRHSDGDVSQVYNPQPPHTRAPDAAGPSSSEFAEPPPPYEPSQAGNNNNANLSSQHSTGSKQSTAALPVPASPQLHQHQREQHRPLVDTSPSSPVVGTSGPTPSSPHVSEIHPSPPIAASSPSTTNGSFVVVAKYDFGGQEQGDLPFKAGDHIVVTQWTEDRDSWWHGQMGSKSGTFPANYTDNL